jgi:hypothetical protein
VVFTLTFFMTIRKLAYIHIAVAVFILAMARDFSIVNSPSYVSPFTKLICLGHFSHHWKIAQQYVTERRPTKQLRIAGPNRGRHSS